jgi:hypothetical protein
MNDHFISTHPKLVQCPICKGWILECHVGGLRKRVEPMELSFNQELAFRIEGRAIFQSVGSYEPNLIHRNVWHINNPDPRAKVFASHSCSTPEIFEPMPLFDLPRYIDPEGVPF